MNFIHVLILVWSNAGVDPGQPELQDPAGDGGVCAVPPAARVSRDRGHLQAGRQHQHRQGARGQDQQGGEDLLL